MNNNVKLELEKIYNLFYYNTLKSYLVATGSNEKYKGIKNNNLLIDVEKVVTAYGLENIFMGQGINMLVSSFERFLKDIFILLASNYDSIEKEIRSSLDPKNKFQGSIKDFIESKRNTFSFQNLEKVSENYKKYIEVDIQRIFNETGAKFEHTDEQEQNRIEEIGFFEYFNKDIWPLRQEMTHASEVP